MKRLHVHVSVEDLEQSIGFYSTMFAAQPTVVKPDYAKWMLEDPRVNFAISTRGGETGLDHLGIQVESEGELREVCSRLHRRTGRCLRRAPPPAATLNLKSPGSPTRRASRGKRSSPRARVRSMATAQTSGRSERFAPPNCVSTELRELAARHLLLRQARPAAGRLHDSPAIQRPVPLYRQFSCTGNSARSVIAESLLNHWGQGRFRAHSAGSFPKGAVHPYALRLLETLGLPTEGLRSKSWDEFARPDAPVMDFVFTVCDQAAGEVCPVWPGQPITAHWGMPDPAAVEGSEVERWQAFRDTLRGLESRIKVFAALPFDALDRVSLKRRLDAIGRMRPDAAESQAS
jgi:arsenate reductase (thioredoxin)